MRIPNIRTSELYLYIFTIAWQGLDDIGTSGREVCKYQKLVGCGLRKNRERFVRFSSAGGSSNGKTNTTCHTRVICCLRSSHLLFFTFPRILQFYVTRNILLHVVVVFQLDLLFAGNVVNMTFFFRDFYSTRFYR